MARAQDRALIFVRRLLGHALRRGQPRLPTIHALARDAHVAPLTMWKAVRRLRDAGLLTARQRNGIRAVVAARPDALPVPPTPPTGRKWQRVRAAIEADITAGTYPPGAQLPAHKQLQDGYAVCFKTLKSALLALVTDGVLRPSGRGYQVPAIASSRVHNTIALVAWAVGDEILSTLDRECTRAGIRLQVMQLFPRDELFAAIETLARGSARSSLLGSVVSITGGFPFQYQEIIAGLLPAGRPVAVVDTTGGARQRPLPGGRLVRLFTIAHGTRPGLQMGRFLAGLGHRRIAYFSAAHDQNWSRDRLTGIAEALGHAGTVRAYTELYDQAAAESAHRRFDAETGKLARTLAVSAAPGVRVAASVVTSLHAQVSDSLQWAQMEEQLKPLMRRALENADSTAWVAANDYMALACLRFLRQEGLAVPGRLSVAGFDDMTAAFAAGLTSYNFNRPAAVHAALSFLAGAGVQRLPHAAGEPVAIDGFVSPRASTAPPRK